MSLRAQLALLGALAFAQALFVALVPLQGVVHLNDELAYTVQARLFAAGMRLAPGLEGPGLLDYPFVETWPRVYGIFPPGWPALLAVGERLGAPALVNPLFAAALPALTWAVAREWLDEARAPVAAAVVACSPGVLLLAGSRMAHTSTLAALLLALAVVLRGRDRAGWWWAAGLGLGYMVLARPFDGVVLGGPLALWGLTRARGGSARVGLVLPALVAAGLVLLDNHVVTGDWRSFPANAWFDAQAQVEGRAAGCNRLGFGPERGCVKTLGSYGHTPLKALEHIGTAARLLDRLLLGVPGGGLVALAGLWMAGRRGLVLAGVLLTVGGYALYWSPGVAYGARFWHPLYALLPVGAAWALYRVLGRRAVWAPLVLGPIGLSQVGREVATGYWCVDGSLTRLLEAQGVVEGVVLLRGSGQHTAAWPRLGVDAFRCTPLLERAEVMMRWDPTDPKRGIQPRAAMPDAASAEAWANTHHPGRPVWLLSYDQSTGQQTLVRLNPQTPEP